jgi:nicotinamidase-related amidase
VISTALPACDAGVHVTVVADASAGVTETDHRRALDAMALYSPMIDVADVDTVLASLAQ